jgi:hypothetical protein
MQTGINDRQRKHGPEFSFRNALITTRSNATAESAATRGEDDQILKREATTTAEAAAGCSRPQLAFTQCAPYLLNREPRGGESAGLLLADMRSAGG